VASSLDFDELHREARRLLQKSNRHQEILGKFLSLTCDDDGNLLRVLHNFLSRLHFLLLHLLFPLFLIHPCTLHPFIRSAEPRLPQGTLFLPDFAARVEKRGMRTRNGKALTLAADQKPRSITRRTLPAKEGSAPSFGARPLKRLLQREVTNRLSKEVLAGTVEPGDRVRIEADGDGLKVVKVGENGATLDDVLVHDAHAEDHTLQMKLALMNNEQGFPVALGIIRDVESPTYEACVEQQIEDVKGRAAYHNFTELLETNDIWEVK